MANKYDYRELRQIINANHDRFSSLNFDDSFSPLQKMNALAEWFKIVLKEFNDVVAYLDDFQAKFDEKLYNTVSDVLDEWASNGKFMEAIYETFGESLKELDSKITSLQNSKVDKGGNEQITKPMIARELWEELSGQQITIDVNTSMIADGAVTTDKTNFMKIGDNLFNKSKAQANKYVLYSDGKAYTDNTAYYLSDFIPVTPETQYVKTTNQQVAFYSTNNESGYISGLSAPYTFTTPSNARFMRTNIHNELINTFQLQKGTYLKGVFDYGKFLPEALLELITREKLNGVYNLTENSSNYFNKETITPNKYVLFSNGQLYDSNDFSVSDFIKVTAGEKYIKNNDQQLAFYSDLRVNSFVSGIQTPSIFTIPTGVNYMRITVPNVFIDRLMLKKNSTTVSDYEDFGRLIPEDSLKSDLKKKINDSERILQQSVNLFDKTKATDGQYIDYSNGKVGSNPSFCASDFILLEIGKTYYKNNNQQFAFYSAPTTSSYVSGVVSSNTLTPPANAPYVRISIPLALKDTFQLEEGTTGSTYQPFGYYVSEDYIDPRIKSQIGSIGGATNIVNVGEGLSANTISKGLSTISSGENVFVYPKTYQEIIEAKNLNDKHVIGYSKKNTIVKDTTGLYENSPLQASGNGSFENITFYTKLSTDIGTANRSYAAHLDYAGEGTLYFRNVDFLSYQNAGVGIGTHANQTIIFEDCLIRAERDGYALGGLYLHNNTESNVLNQKLIFINCIIENANGPIIVIDDACSMASNENSPLEIEFVNCTTYGAIPESGAPNGIRIRSSEGDYLTPSGRIFTPNITLSKRSKGNDISWLNA